MSIRHFFLAALGLTIYATAAQSQPGDAEEPPEQPAEAMPIVELFEPAADVPRAGVIPQGCTVVHGVRMPIDLHAVLVPGRRFTLTPEPGVVISCVVATARQDMEHTLVITARTEDDPQGTVVFAMYDSAVATVLSVPSLRLRYRLHYMGNGDYQVWRLDEAALPPEAPPLAAPPGPPMVRLPGDDDWQPDDKWEPPDDGSEPREGGGCTGSTPILDHLVVYTPAARDAMGGDAAIRAEAALAVEICNTAYANSAMSTRARLVYCNVISYTEGPDQDTDLDRLQDPDDGYMDGVHTTRDNVNADMVILYNNQGSGLGYCPSGVPAYNVMFCTVAWWRAAATFTHAHETGHNLGGGHDVANGGACGPSYGVGHLFNGTDGNGYCTMMAYPDATHSRVQHYSNPNVSYQGTPTGIPIGQPGEAYNARVLTDNDNTVEDFELTRFDIYVNFAWAGAENGTYAQPYNTMTEGINAIAVPSTGAADVPNLYVRTGTTTWTGTISKRMTITPCSGGVTVGD